MGREEITGLIIGKVGLDFATLRRDKGAWSVVASDHIPAVADGTEAVSTAALLTSCAARLTGRLTIGIPSESLMLRTLKLPGVTDDELAGMVQLQVDKFSPFPVESMVISHEIIERRPDACIVWVAGIRLDWVEKLGNDLKAAGLVADRLDVAVAGWVLLLRDASAIPPTGRHVAVILHGETPEIVFFDGGTPVMFTSVPGVAGLTPDELAEELCQTLNYMLMSLELEHGAESTTSLTLWYHDVAPGEFVERFKSEHDWEVSTRRLDDLPQLAEGLARRVAKGARMDLTPPAWRAAAHARQFKKQMIMTALSIVAVCLAFFAVLFSLFAFEKVSLASMEREAKQLSAQATTVANTKRRVILIKRYMDRGTAPLEILREISMQQPNGVDLLEFTYRKSEGVELKGEADSVSLVYDFKNALDANNFFISSTLTGPKYEPRRNQQLFGVTLKLREGVIP